MKRAVEQQYVKRVQRLLVLINAMKTDPHQTPATLSAALGISRSMFYKDCQVLQRLGFAFRYQRRQRQFVITQDQFFPALNLSISEVLALIMAVRQLSSTGDYTLTYEAIAALRKVLSNMPAAVRTFFQTSLDDVVLQEGFGCDAAIVQDLWRACQEHRRLHVVHDRGNGPQEWIIDPYQQVLPCVEPPRLSHGEEHMVGRSRPTGFSPCTSVIASIYTVFHAILLPTQDTPFGSQQLGVAVLPGFEADEKVSPVLPDILGSPCKSTSWSLGPLPLEWEPGGLLKAPGLSHGVTYILFKRRALYLDACVVAERQVKMFRINRIKHVRFANIPPLPTPIVPYNFHERHRHSFSVFVGEQVQRVRVKFRPEMRQYITESRWHSSQQIETLPDGSIIWQVEVNEPREVGWWALQWGASAEVLEPESLRREMAETARRLVEVYDTGGEEAR